MLHQSASHSPESAPAPSDTRSANAARHSAAGLSEHVSARLRARAQQRSTSPIKADLQVDAPGDSVSDAANHSNLVHQLAREVRALETAGRKSPANSAAIGSGCQAMDRCLPDGGYAPGSVIEYLRAMPGCGASTLAFTAAASAMRATNGFIVVVDTQHNIYPPSLTSWGIDLDKLVLVRPQSDVDALWVVDQSLRTPAVAAVVADVERIDDRAARRMQLAAEQGGGLAFLLRPASARRGPSWAEVQWMVRAVPTASDAQDRRLQVQLVRVRAGKAGASVQLRVSAMDGTLHEVERHESTSAMHLASQLANTTRPSRRASAG